VEVTLLLDETAQVVRCCRDYYRRRFEFVADKAREAREVREELAAVPR
jgi:hypothetical protein